MILVIGSENCSKCKMTKTILENKKVNFEYKLLESLSLEEQKKYINMAQKANQMSMPIIVKDNKITTLQQL